MTVDDAKRGGRAKPIRSQHRQRIQDCAAAGHHIFDQDERFSSQRRSLGVPAGAIFLRVLSDECRGQAEFVTQHRDDGDAAHFKSGKNLRAGRNQRSQRSGDIRQKHRIGFKLVFVEIGVAYLA